MRTLKKSITFRLDPTTKDLLRLVAKKENRSIANLIETLIIRYCGQKGIKVKPDEE